MAPFNNPLLLVAASAFITALITSAVETTITSRQKHGFERRLEQLRHKHELQIEQLKHLNSVELEELASRLNLEAERARVAAEQRLVKLPRAMEAIYRTRYLALEVIDDLATRREGEAVQARIHELFDAGAALSSDLFAVEAPDFLLSSGVLLQLLQWFASKALHISHERHSESHDDVALQAGLSSLRDAYEQMKRLQMEMMDVIVKPSRPPNPE